MKKSYTIKRFFSVSFTVLLMLSVVNVSYAQNAQINSTVLSWDLDVGCTVFSEIKEPGSVGIPVQMLSEDLCLNVCDSATVNYTIQDISGTVNYIIWNITGGVILNNAGDAIEVVWGNAGDAAAVSVTIFFDDGEQLTQSQCVDIIPSPDSIIGIAGPEAEVHCVNADINLRNLSTANGGSQIVAQQWNVYDISNGTLVFSSNTFEPILNFDQEGVYEVVLTTWNECNCADTESLLLTIEGDSLPIVCPTVTCEDAIETYFIDDPERRCETYQWEVTGGTIVNTDNDFTVDVLWNEINEDGFGYVSFLQNGCTETCAGWTTVKVPVVTTEGVIKGDGIICQNDQYRYKLPQWPTTRFDWTLRDSGGNDFTFNNVFATGQRNEVIVDTNNLPPGEYTIQSDYNNTLLLCGGSASKNIVVLPQLTIEAPPIICQGVLVITPSNEYVTIFYDIYFDSNLIGSQTYQGITEIQLNEPGSYIITAAAKGFCSIDPIIVTVLPIPSVPNVQSPNNYGLPEEICLNTPYVLTYTNDDPDSYVVWEPVGPGNNAQIQGTSIGDSVNVIFTGYPAQIKLKRIHKQNENCSSDYRTLFLTPATISGAVQSTPTAGITSYCPSTTAQFRVDEITGAENYEWYFETENFGSIVSGQGTNVITVLFNEVSNANTDELRLRVRKCGFWQELNNNNIPFITPLTISLFTTPSFQSIVVNPDPTCPNSEVTATVNLTQPINFGASQSITVTVNGIADTAITYPSAGAHSSFDISNITMPASLPGQTNNLQYVIEITVNNINGCLGSIRDTTTVSVLPGPQVTATLDGNSGNVFCGVQNINSLFNITTSTVSPIVNYELQSLSNNNSPVPGTFIRSIGANSVTIHPSDGFGWFVVQVTDANGCVGYSRPFSVGERCNNNNGCIPVPINVEASWDACNVINVASILPAGYIPNSVLWLNNNSVGITPGPNNDSNAIFMVNKPGDYRIGVRAIYMVNGQPCVSENVTVITVGYQASLNYTATCGANGNYDITLFDTSEILPGGEPDNTYREIVDNNTGNITQLTIPPGTNNVTISIPPGNYTLQVRHTDAMRPTCIATENVVIEALTPPIFEVRSSKDPNTAGSITETCVECPVQLLINPAGGGPNPNLTYRWEFANTANLVVEPEVTLVAGANREVKLIATDLFGCTAESIYTLNVNSNSLDIQVGFSGSICEGSEIDLNALAFGLPLQSSDPVQWLLDDTEIPNATDLTYSASVQGLYWVKTYDIYGCENTSPNSVYVAVKKAPYIEIDNLGTACAGEAFDITAIVDTGATYTWLKDGTAIPGFINLTALSSSITLTQTISTSAVTPPSTSFDYSLMVVKDGCSAEASVTIEIFDIDAISLDITSTTCSPYTVSVQAMNVPANASITWSTGASGTSSINVNHGGWVAATVRLPSGCTVVAQVEVPHDPEEFIWIFPSGCMNFCLGKEQLLNRSIIGPLEMMDNWEWQFNTAGTAPFISTLPSQTEDYLLTDSSSSGMHNLNLTIGNCTVASEPLYLMVNADCDECELALMEEQLVFNSDTGVYELYGILDLSGFSFPLTIDFYESQGQGFVTPATVTFLNPLNSYTFPPLLLTPFSNAPLAIVELAFTITSEGRSCTSRHLYRNYARGSEERPEGKLALSPNPAQQKTTVDYAMDLAYGQSSKFIELYTLQGVLMSSTPVKDVTGSAEIYIDRLPSGTYVVILRADGTQLQRSLLIKE